MVGYPGLVVEWVNGYSVAVQTTYAAVFKYEKEVTFF